MPRCDERVYLVEIGDERVGITYDLISEKEAEDIDAFLAQNNMPPLEKTEVQDASPV